MNRFLKRPPLDTPGLYQTEDGDALSRMVYAHYFTNTGADWYVLEYSPNLDVAFGWVEILPGCGEYGTFLIQELEEVRIDIPIRLVHADQHSEEVNVTVTVEHDDNWERKSMESALECHRTKFYGKSEMHKNNSQRFPFPRL